MSKKIRASLGESETLSVTVSTTDATTISADTFKVTLAPYDQPPAVSSSSWATPNTPVVIDASHVRLDFAVGASRPLNPVPADYWRWVLVNDTGGDVRLIRVPGRITIA